MMLVKFCTGLKPVPWKQTQKSFNLWHLVKNLSVKPENVL